MEINVTHSQPPMGWNIDVNVDGGSDLFNHVNVIFDGITLADEDCDPPCTNWTKSFPGVGLNMPQQRHKAVATVTLVSGEQREGKDEWSG